MYRHNQEAIRAHPGLHPDLDRRLRARALVIALQGELSASEAADALVAMAGATPATPIAARRALARLENANSLRPSTLTAAAAEALRLAVGRLSSAAMPAAETEVVTATAGTPSETRRLSLVRGDAAARMEEREAHTAATTTTAAEAGAEFPRSVRVLLVDDQASTRDLVRWTLEDDQRFRVVGEAPDGREAVALARHHQPDLVLLDLAMPGVGGLEALPLLRAVAPQARIVVFSSLDPADVADRALSQGAAGYLCKGGEPDRLLDDLQRILASDVVLRPAGGRTGHLRGPSVGTGSATCRPAPG